MSVDKAALDLSLLCQIVCSTQISSRLLIVQMRFNQSEQFGFACGCTLPKVEEHHRFLPRIINCRTHYCFIIRTASRKDRQDSSWKIFLNSGYHYRDPSLSLVKSIIGV